MCKIESRPDVKMGMHQELMMTSPDTRFSLIGRLQDAGDAEAWNEFIQVYQPLIFRIARRRGLQHADAAEVTQDVLSRVSQAIQNWEPDPQRGTFRGWLYRITRNLTIDFLRRHSRQATVNSESGATPLGQLAAPTDEPSREFQLEFERQLFSWAAKRIQGNYRASSWQAFWKTAVEGQDVASVAEELGISPGAIYVARSRIMKHLTAEVKLRASESLG